MRNKLAETLKAPLKKVVGTERNEFGVIVEVLECGHRQHVKQDAYGEYYANRRRCRGCKRESRSGEAKK